MRAASSTTSRIGDTGQRGVVVDNHRIRSTRDHGFLEDFRVFGKIQHRYKAHGIGGFKMDPQHVGSAPPVGKAVRTSISERSMRAIGARSVSASITESRSAQCRCRQAMVCAVGRRFDQVTGQHDLPRGKAHAFLERAPRRDRRLEMRGTSFIQTRDHGVRSRMSAAMT